MLHDVIDDTAVTLGELETAFGEQVGAELLARCILWHSGASCAATAAFRG